LVANVSIITKCYIFRYGFIPFAPSYNNIFNVKISPKFEELLRKLRTVKIFSKEEHIETEEIKKRPKMQSEQIKLDEHSYSLINYLRGKTDEGTV
jgi:hypothetical protein